MGALAALDQRIGPRYTVPPMTSEEAGSYLRHHLGLVGRSDPLFSDDAAALIHQTSRGYPRAVNNLELQALVAAFADDKTIVDESPASRSPKSRHSEHYADTLNTTTPPSTSSAGRSIPGHAHFQCRTTGHPR